MWPSVPFVGLADDMGHTYDGHPARERRHAIERRRLVEAGCRRSDRRLRGARTPPVEIAALQRRVRPDSAHCCEQPSIGVGRVALAEVDGEFVVATVPVLVVEEVGGIRFCHSLVQTSWPSSAAVAMSQEPWP